MCPCFEKVINLDTPTRLGKRPQLDSKLTFVMGKQVTIETLFVLAGEITSSATAFEELHYLLVRALGREGLESFPAIAERQIAVSQRGFSLKMRIILLPRELARLSRKFEIPTQIA